MDPLPSYLGRGVNDHKNADIRSVLTPFLGVIAECDIAMEAITHLNKSIDPNRPASHRILGSIGYGNLARSISFVAKDPDNPKRRLFMQAENNLAPSDLPAVAFTLEAREVTNKAAEVFEIWVPRFEDKTVEVDVNEVVNSGPKRPARGPMPRKTTEVALWLLGFLKADAHPVRLRDVFNAAGAKGYVGELKPVEDGKLKWSIPITLYRAKDMIATLEGEDAGWAVKDLQEGKQVFWQLVRADLEREDDAPITPY